MLISDEKTLPIRAGSKVRQKCELFTRTDYIYTFLSTLRSRKGAALDQAGEQ